MNFATFHNRDHGRALIMLYGRHYSERRPHIILGYLTPKELAETWKMRQGAGTVLLPATQ